MKRTGTIAQVVEAKSLLKFSEREFPSPGTDQVLVKIEACGICHSDSFAFDGHFPGLKYPLIPGHEIAGTVVEAGNEVSRVKVGDRVGVGWHGGHCHHCSSCHRGDFVTCARLQTPGINRDGGYAEFGIFPEEACALIPAEISFAEAGPLMCAGVTTFNALRNSGARGGDTVAILGLGGLGHLAVQFASKMGFRTVAIARGAEKASFAKELGAQHYIDSQEKDAVAKLQQLGGANVLLSTITNSAAMTPWVESLAIGGQMLIVGADVEPIQVSPIFLLSRRAKVAGWPSGSSADSQDCMNFAALSGVRPMIEEYAFKDAGAAFERMISGKARFRVVLKMS